MKKEQPNNDQQNPEPQEAQGTEGTEGTEKQETPAFDEAAYLKEKADRIRFLNTQAALNCIEIGEILLEVKDRVQPKTWQEWIEQNISFSIRHCQNFMALARTYGNSEKKEALAQLGVAKLLVLSPLGVELSEAMADFLEHEDMRKRDLEELVGRLQKTKEQAITDRTQLRIEIERVKAELAEAKAAKVRTKIVKVQEAPKEFQEELDTLRDQLSTARTASEHNAEVAQTLRSQLTDLEAKLAENSKASGINFKAVNEELKKALEQVKLVASERDKAKADLAASLAKMQAIEKERSEDLNGNVISAIEAVRTENVKLKAENVKLKAENAALRKENAGLKKQEKAQEKAAA